MTFTAQGSLGIQKMVLNSGQVTLGDPDSLYTPLQSEAFETHGGTYVLPAGIWMILGVANVSVEICTDGDTAWSTLIAAGKGGTVISDGYNIRLSSTTVATAQAVGIA
jgi:hypothetical protein